MIHQGAYEAGFQNIRFHRPLPYYGQPTGPKRVQSFPVPWNTGAEPLYVKMPNGYVPPVLMQVYKIEGSHDYYRNDAIYERKGFLDLFCAFYSGGLFFRLFCGGGNNEQTDSSNSGSGNPS